MKLKYIEKLFWEVRNDQDVKVSSTIVCFRKQDVIDFANVYGGSFQPHNFLTIEGMDEYLDFLETNEKNFVKIQRGV